MVLIAYNPNRGRRRAKWPEINAPFAIGNTGIVLRPAEYGKEGYNKVATPEWEKLLQHPSFGPTLKARIDAGIIQVIDPPSSNSKDNEPSPMDFTLPKLKDVVEQCFDLNLLKEWRQIETRSGGLTVIDAQIAKLTPKKAEPKEEA